MYLTGGYMNITKIRYGFTLGEVFSHHNHTNRKAAFTLAEVLITLGIIGVVAALTLPALIQNYQKNVILNRLKVNYNILSNAIRKAEAEFGEITSWDLVNYRVEDYEDEDRAQAKTKAGEIVKKYLMPHLVGAQFTETSTLKDLGYKRGIFYPGGETYAQTTYSGPILRLNNGTIILLHPQKGKLSSTGESRLVGLNFYMDVDGPNGKNIVGKDVFIVFLPYTLNAKLMFYHNYWEINNKILQVLPMIRSELIANCKSSGSYCGALIQMDGWQIKNDYPLW